jgi:hypothetical protein
MGYLKGKSALMIYDAGPYRANIKPSLEDLKW